MEGEEQEEEEHEGEEEPKEGGTEENDEQDEENEEEDEDDADDGDHDERSGGRGMPTQRLRGGRRKSSRSRQMELEEDGVFGQIGVVPWEPVGVWELCAGSGRLSATARGMISVISLLSTWIDHRQRSSAFSVAQRVRRDREGLVAPALPRSLELRSIAER